MTIQDAGSDLDIDSHRKYYIKFRKEQFRRELDWEEIRATFERTAEAVRTLIDGYRETGAFGDEELTALKSVVQLSKSIGPEKTQKRVLDSNGPSTVLDRVTHLVDEGTGIVGGPALPASVGDVAPDTVLDVLGKLQDEQVPLEVLDTAAQQLLEFEFENAGGRTLSVLLSLLQPTRFPIVNQQTIEVFDWCFDIELSAAAENYLESAERFRTVRDAFGFDERLRQLDYFCYWLREETAPAGSPLPEDIDTRNVWQIDVTGLQESDSAALWSIWQELDICSMRWDIGPLDELSPEEIGERAEQFGNTLAGDCLLCGDRLRLTEPRLEYTNSAAAKATCECGWRGDAIYRLIDLHETQPRTSDADATPDSETTVDILEESSSVRMHNIRPMYTPY